MLIVFFFKLQYQISLNKSFAKFKLNWRCEYFS